MEIWRGSPLNKTHERKAENMACEICEGNHATSHCASRQLGIAAASASLRGAVVIIDSMDALGRANAALRTLMNCTEIMNAHELALACNNTIDLIQAEQARRSASIGAISCREPEKTNL